LYIVGPRTTANIAIGTAIDRVTDLHLNCIMLCLNEGLLHSLYISLPRHMSYALELFLLRAEVLFITR